MDPDPNPGSPGYNMAIVALGAYLIRYVDFLDTLFFILRKKFGNVSTLQESIIKLYSIYERYCKICKMNITADNFLRMLLRLSA